jgi:hypothetical protein
MDLEQPAIINALTKTYMIDIYKASNNSPNISDITVELVKAITDTYQYLEPSHFNGELVIFSTLDNSILPLPKPEKIHFNMDVLITLQLQSRTIVIQKINNELLLWKNTNLKTLMKIKNILFYHYKNRNEYFYINNKQIDINLLTRSPSIFSIYYSSLEDSLKNYSIENILNTSCEHFKFAWADKKRIYFKNKPEEIMHLSLREYLKNSLRGVEVLPEFNFKSKKQVDIRVSWGSANRSAHIEVKWLGVSLDKKKRKTATPYTKARAISGAKQLKDYLDFAASDSPGIITKGYLVVIDGRRKGINNKILKTISQKNGHYYEKEEIIYPDEYNKIPNFEQPLRMFARPICQ